MACNHQSTVSRNHEFGGQIEIGPYISALRSDFPQLWGDARDDRRLIVAPGQAAWKYCRRLVSMIRWPNAGKFGSSSRQAEWDLPTDTGRT